MQKYEFTEENFIQSNFKYKEVYDFWKGIHELNTSYIAIIFRSPDDKDPYIIMEEKDWENAPKPKKFARVAFYCGEILCWIKWR